MSAFFRKIFMALIGLTAGVLAWAAVEILLRQTDIISRHIVWNGLSGAVLGVIFGFFFGSAEGIMFSDVRRSLRSGSAGAVIGLIGGTAGVILAQGLMYWIGNAELFSPSAAASWVTPFSRTLGWTILGLAAGGVDGIRSGSARRTGIGMAGGVLGGLLGGLLLEFLPRYWTDSFLARGIGIGLMGLFIGLFFSLFEHSRAFGLIRVLTGSFRGKEYVLVMKKTRIGASRHADIPLGTYAGVVKNHALLTADREGVTVKGVDGTVQVNDRPIADHQLKYEDVIQIGNARLFYLPR